MQISIFTDLRFTESDTPTGVGKHIEQMAMGLHSNSGVNVRVLAASDQIEGNGRIASDNILNYLPATRLPLKWKTAEAIWTLTGGPAVDRYCQDADWVYCPKNDFVPLNNTKLAVTIHGAHELDPNMPKSPGFKSHLNRIRRRLSYQRIVKRADLILTVSEFLKNQVVNWFGANPDDIVVVGNGVEQVFFDVGKETISYNDVLQEPYLLCVGGLNFNDGGGDIIEVAKELKKTSPEIEIHIAGWQHEESYLKQVESLNNIKLLGYVKAEDLSQMMKKSLGLLFLTNYETFGIAAAEAMAIGTPVITSGRTAVREIVGSAGVYVNPADAQDTVEKVRYLLNNAGYRDRMIESGKTIAQNYTWDACVTRLSNAFRERS